MGNQTFYDKEKQKVPVKVWSDLANVETQALDQLKNIARLPFVFKHVAAMPDVHLGKGATVGSVIATKGAVIPAAVGVDIGCGMMALKLNIEPGKILDKTKEIRLSIERSIPVGHHSNKIISKPVESWMGWSEWNNLHAINDHIKGTKTLQATALSQLGSLGGGNHFIELCTDTEGFVWALLHSGSRNIGKSLAEIHINRAKGEMQKMFISLADPDLAYYVEGTEFYNQYLRDLMWVQSYASKEHHYGENVLVTRKGAVRARKGDLGIIPGSMGAKSYIVEGLGNAESFHSCSHGAGRRMSRSEAKKKFSLEDLAQQTLGVDCRKDIGVLDEIPGAYKNIDEVMENQKDLVRVVAQLKQFMCIKG